jgi:hypothetical protein
VVLKRKRLRKLAALASGFLIISGLVFLGLAALSSLGFLDIGNLLENRHVLLFALAVVLVGVFDMLSAIAMAYW